MKLRWHNSTIITRPEQKHWPISLTDVKNYLRIPSDDHSQDIMINDAIVGVLEHCERYTNRFLIPGTVVRLQYPQIERYNDVWLLPPDIKQINNVEDGATGEELNYITNFAYVQPSKSGAIWPAITVECGKFYEQVRIAMLLQLSQIMDARGAEFSNEKAVKAQLDPLVY